MNGSQYYSEAHMVRMLGKTDEHAQSNDAQANALEATRSVLMRKVKANQDATEKTRVAKHLQELRAAICGEPTNLEGDMSQNKVLRIIDTKISALLAENG